MPADAPDNAGHRARLRQRLLADPDGLHDHELLEYLLATALPRIDTKPIAKRLLHEFGDLAGVFAAESGALTRISGMGESGAAAIRVAQATATRMLRATARSAPVLANWQALIDYLRVSMAHRMIEQVRVLHLNARNLLIHDELMAEGSIDEAPVYAREVIRRAIELGSTAVILVHNHPSGDPTPSRADIEITRTIVQAGKSLGIAVHDHLIVGREGTVSLRAQGLI